LFSWTTLPALIETWPLESGVVEVELNDYYFFCLPTIEPLLFLWETGATETFEKATTFNFLEGLSSLVVVLTLWLDEAIAFLHSQLLLSLSDCWYCYYFYVVMLSVSEGPIECLGLMGEDFKMPDW
jgi:hypothetical protein